MTSGVCKHHFVLFFVVTIVVDGHAVVEMIIDVDNQ